MDDFLDLLEEKSNWKQLMRSSCKQNHLSTLMAVDLTILKLRKFNQKFKKSNISLNYKIKTFWVQNQLRAFNWILIAVSGLQKVKIQDFGEDEWKILQDIFYAKDLLFLKFQAKRLTQNKKTKKKKWDIQQDQRLYKYANQFELEHQRIAWNQIALKMFADSNGTIFREGKHCRQHWLNYLDPTKTRGKWTIEQDIYLIQSVNSGGKKWCQCALQLKRTQHSVKNRYNSLLVKQQKLTPLINKQHKLIRQLLFRLKDIKMNQNYIQSSQEQRQNSSIKIEEQQNDQNNRDDIRNKQDFNEQHYSKHMIKNGDSNNNKIDNPQYQDNENMAIEKDKQELGQKHQQNVEQNNNNNMTRGVNLCASFDFGNYIREDMQNKNYPQYPILSPFIYSPSPTNCLSSPVFIIKQPTVHNAFQFMFSMWGNHINMPMEPMQKKQQQKQNQ